MRLNSSIFLWVFPAAVLPLTALVLIATTYGERSYLKQVDEEVFAGLTGVADALEARLLIERDLVQGLASVPAIRQLQSALVQPHTTTPAREQASRFLETFQTVRTSLATVRILDQDGETLVKVSDGEREVARLSGPNEWPLIERLEKKPSFRDVLEALPVGEAATLLLPPNEGQTPAERVDVPIYTLATALFKRGGPASVYLTIDPPLQAFNRILSIAPRVQKGALLIAEVNPGIAQRNGLVLYDDISELTLTDTGPRPSLATLYPELLERAFHKQTGMLDSPQGGERIYYREFLPYHDQLVSWMIATRIDKEELRAPFKSIRIGILSSLFIALMLSLLLAQFGARRIANPIMKLAARLSSFARGERAERVAVQGPEEIQQAAKAFNEMADSLDAAEQARDQAQLETYRSAKLASLGQMAAGIGHEISNPLNTILSLTTLIERELDPMATGMRKDVQSIREETKRAAKTVKAILNFSNQIGGEQSIFSVREVLDEAATLVRNEEADAPVTIEIQQAGPCAMKGDPNLLLHAVRNLLLNAVHASPDGGLVTLMTRQTEQGIQISVRDQGKGIDQDHVDKVFDPFFTTKAEGQGSGLGLSVALGVAQYHGGELNLRNRTGGGAVATLTLPSCEPSPGTSDDVSNL